MRLVLTILCRNEVDIISTTIDYHLCKGVDHIIVTDNGSTDGTTEILENYASKGSLQLLHEPSHTHDQAVWVSRMAQIAVEEQSADWVIHCDADEFWWPHAGDLKLELDMVPAHIKALAVQRFNFLPPAPGFHPNIPFHQIQTIRERQSLNSIGAPLPAKICHRSIQGAWVGDGNHKLFINGNCVGLTPWPTIDILHYPVRSYAQLELKIRNGAEALARNSRVAELVGRTWREVYQSHLCNGTLPSYYAQLRPTDELIAQKLLSGELVEDIRLTQLMAR